MSAGTSDPKAIFFAALDLPSPAERSRYLDTACGGDPDLRSRVERLLAAHEQAGHFLGGAGATAATADRTSEIEAFLSPESEMPLDFLRPSEQPGHLGRLGHYEVLEVVGRGGMGIVLRAFDEKLHRVVAIKVMAPQLATSAAARKRFSREAQAAAAVSHDHVVTIHAVEEAGGLPYLAMQYVSGPSLQQRLDKSGPLELREIVRIGMQTAAGLAAAHAQGLIHRDIKPANILLENGVERVKITDFGLARAVADASMTQTGMVAGTPQYMSPEQARGETVDRRSDLFSLGSVLYAMCTGRPPFRGDSGIAVLKRVCDDTPRPIRETNDDIPEWLVALIAKLHAKDPAERYLTAAEVAELLNEHLAHLQHPSVVPLPAAPVGNALRGVPHKTRRLWATAAAVLLCVVGGLGLTEAAGVTKLTATVIRVLTPEGTLVVEVDDPGVKVTVEGDGGLVITGAGPQEVRLRPGSYKVRATKDGKSIREEELITITRGDKRVVKVSHEATSAPATPTTAKPADQPFVVLTGTGVMARRFDTLAEAVLGASDGDTIEIRGNGPFVTAPIVITLPSLTIRAGEGFRPVIEASPPGLRPGVSLLSTQAGLAVEHSPNARLVLEGLEFRCELRDGKAERNWNPLLHTKRPLHVANCRFLTKNTDVLIQTDFGPPVELRNCEFLGTDLKSAIFPNSPQQSGPGVRVPRLVVHNCLLTAGVFVNHRLPSPRDGSIRLTGNTFLGIARGVIWFAPNIDHGSNFAEADWHVKALRVEASGNLFNTSPVFRLTQGNVKEIMLPEDAQGCLARMVGWQGERNLYADSGAFLDLEQPASIRAANDITGLAGWREFWETSEADSVEGRVHYQGGDLRARLADAPEKLNPDDFRLRPDSTGYRAGPDGKDFGAAIDLVGPGPAYERWKKTPEYQEWLKNTGQRKESGDRTQGTEDSNAAKSDT